jgi:1-acyl-sn-glycerol-3-phosphate acyltransferase
MRLFFRGLFHLLARITIEGRENVPYGKPYLAAMNHISTFDPPFALTFWPEDINALGAADIWQRKGFGQNMLVRLYGGIPVQRSGYDRLALDKATCVLKSGHPLLMAPEGGRTHVTAMRQARPGLAFIVELTGVPVVPVGIFGTTDDFFQKAIRGARPDLRMRIGRPILLPPVEGKGDARRESRQHNTDLVMAHVAGLLPEHYRGYYAETAIVPK